ncbi:MAG: histidine kinase [Chitinophagaceae bacterium]|nr:histidine kinase [Chitinophagaceae bacterium]
MKKHLSVLAITYAVVLGVNLFVNYGYYMSGGSWQYSVLFSLSLATMGALGGTTFLTRIFESLNWSKQPVVSFGIGVSMLAVYGGLIMFVAMKAMALMGYADPGIDTYRENMMYSALFSMIVGLIVSGKHFVVSLQRSTVENERMKQEMIRSKYETLKNQVNPHFLFNALNTLPGLIKENPDNAVAFVEQMARVMRYSLQHQDEQTVQLSTELQVAESYLFLQKQRFDDKLIVEVNVSAAGQKRSIVTHALLLVVENAIKHNEISKKHPLKISISDDTDTLIVTNNYNPRPAADTSTGLGLNNIRNRYALITGQEVPVMQTDEEFRVALPLL